MREINTKDCHVRFGKFIQDARLAENLYQEEIAEKCGISQSYLSKIESGKRDIDLALAIKICDVLKLNIQEFISDFI